MVRILIDIAWHYCRSEFTERLYEGWSAVILGGILHWFWNGTGDPARMAAATEYVIHVLEVVTIVVVSKIAGASGSDMYKLFFGPKIIKPIIKKISQLFKNDKDKEKRA